MATELRDAFSGGVVCTVCLLLSLPILFRGHAVVYSYGSQCLLDHRVWSFAHTFFFFLFFFLHVIAFLLSTVDIMSMHSFYYFLCVCICACFLRRRRMVYTQWLCFWLLCGM